MRRRDKASRLEFWKYRTNIDICYFVQPYLYLLCDSTSYKFSYMTQVFWDYLTSILKTWLNHRL